jgi:SPP1 gp7 family putative phage head morphogenesis protein
VLITGAAQAVLEGFGFFAAVAWRAMPAAKKDGLVRKELTPRELLESLIVSIEPPEAGERAATLPGPVRRGDVLRVKRYVEKNLGNSLIKLQVETLEEPFLRDCETQLREVAAGKLSKEAFRIKVGKLANRYGIEFKGSIADTWYTTTLNASYNRALLVAYRHEPTSRLIPHLAIRTVGDDRVRPSHAALDGFVAETSWKGWPKYTPPFGYRCRCRLVPVLYQISKSLGWTDQAFPRGGQFLAPKEGKGGTIVPGAEPGFESILQLA